MHDRPGPPVEKPAGDRRGQREPGAACGFGRNLHRTGRAALCPVTEIARSRAGKTGSGGDGRRSAMPEWGRRLLGWCVSGTTRRRGPAPHGGCRPQRAVPRPAPADDKGGDARAG
ncbi:hypothetical protein GCM10009605_59010 [Nocardiopsis composta]